jgi:hypothetical protein
LRRMKKRNTTSDKGDIAVAKVIADLTSKGIKVAMPISAHLPFDIIAISNENKLTRIQVKYCGGKDAIKLSTRTISVSSKEVVKKVNFNYVDAYAAYSPDTDLVYYVNKKNLKSRKTCFTLRLKKSSIIDKRIKYADEYMNPSILWKNNFGR